MPLYPRALPPSVLMDVSELRIEHMRWAGSDTERRVVNRLFESADVYRQWESYHAGLMRRVGRDETRKGQLVSLRQTRFELIHRQALFEFVRESGAAPRDREALFRVLHRTQDFHRAVLAEHARFLQSNSSLYCADHLAYSIMGDLRFTRGLSRYRRRYLTYFGYHCQWVMAEARGEDAPGRRLLPQLKKELQAMQRDLLALPAPRSPAPH